MRVAEVKRKTAETDVYVKLNLDGTGQCDIDSGIGFFDHMLILFSKHSRFDLTVKCKGDIEVDGHHTTEDIGIALGQAFKEALGDKRGIHRYGSTILPMDEALIMTAVDISGRPYLKYRMKIPAAMVG
ncbi:MAG: imidazoleglycerol-phosphate dehydratase, partial [Clostridia bacterium]|nr:imidazoleglycerol-phosphate dehydratase [Clostridia bacterium]